jgi:DNA-binding beta-propeller fold protein YncE
METGKPLSVSSPAVVESMDSTVYKGYSFIVYASSTTHTVERVSLDGRFQVTLASGLPKPHGVAVDQKTQNVYYSDAVLGFIELVDFEGRFRVRCLSGLQRSGGLAFDHVTGYLYYSDFGTRPVIGRLAGDCSTNSVIVRSGLGSPVHLALDENRRVLYWTDSKLRVLRSYDIKTRRMVAILTQMTHGFPFGIYFADDKLFWTDWTTRCVYYSSTPCLDTASRLICRTSSTDVPEDVTCTRPNAFELCTTCEPPQFCVTSPKGFICRCPTGYVKDGKKCKLPGHFVLVATLGSLKAISVNGIKDWSATLPIPPQRSAVALDYDYREEIVFWTDMALPARIQSARFDGSELKLLVSHNAQRSVCQLCAPIGIAFDWVCRCLYWSDDCTGEICYICLDSLRSGIKQLVDNLNKPRGITVNPDEGKLYFTEGGPQPYIAEFDLPTCKKRSGDDDRLQTQSIQIPNDLALLDSSTLLYINVGSPRNYIGLVDLKGVNSARSLLQVNGQLFSLDTCNGIMYWTDSSSNQVSAADIRNLNPKSLASIRGYGIKAVCLGNQATASTSCLFPVLPYTYYVVSLWYARNSNGSCVLGTTDTRRGSVFQSQMCVGSTYCSQKNYNRERRDDKERGSGIVSIVISRE